MIVQWDKVLGQYKIYEKGDLKKCQNWPLANFGV